MACFRSGSGSYSGLVSCYMACFSPARNEKSMSDPASDAAVEAKS